MCCPAVHLRWREPGAGIIPILSLGKLRLYTRGCWREGLNSGLRDSGTQLGKQAPEACEPPWVSVSPSAQWVWSGGCGCPCPSPGPHRFCWEFPEPLTGLQLHPQSHVCRQARRCQISSGEPATFGVRFLEDWDCGAFQGRRGPGRGWLALGPCGSWLAVQPGLCLCVI